MGNRRTLRIDMEVGEVLPCCCPEKGAKMRWAASLDTCQEFPSGGYGQSYRGAPLTKVMTTGQSLLRNP